MSDPQPHHLKPKPKRAEPWQPDRPGSGDEQQAATTNEPTADRGDKSGVPSQASKPGRATSDPSPGSGDAKANAASGSAASPVSPEAAIERDPQTGQARNDRSLVSGDTSGRSDGGSNSTRLPES